MCVLAEPTVRLLAAGTEHVLEDASLLAHILLPVSDLAGGKLPALDLAFSPLGRKSTIHVIVVEERASL